MMKHEGNKMGMRLQKRARLVAAATALVSAFALSAPAVAGASCRSSNANLITQNTAMIVDVSGTSATTSATVSWGDVSWSDVY
jgi:hypothetical protein